MEKPRRAGPGEWGGGGEGGGGGGWGGGGKPGYGLCKKQISSKPRQDWEALDTSGYPGVNSA